MLRLAQLILFTPDLGRMRAFYEKQVGLEALIADPHWRLLGTTGAAIALHPLPPGKEPGIELGFESDDLERDVALLRGRGASFTDEIQDQGWGRLIHLSDPEGNRLGLFQPNTASPRGSGLQFSTAIVNARQMATTRRFYREVVGLLLTTDSPWWVGFDAGPTALALHPRGDAGAEPHHRGSVTVGFAVPGLAAWVEEAQDRWLEFSSPPTDRGFGTFVDAVDPDGNEVTFRDVPEPEPLEEQLAQAFEVDEVPRQAAIRKPVKKRATAGSRLTLKPVHKAKRGVTKRPPPAKPGARVASPRGTGPAGARKKPKRTHDPKRARAKPAIGRLRKAERRTLARKKLAVASTSKTKPVKRASRSRPSKRAVARARTRR
jgi:predicted enzyme related to lactoylglutathione lyase